jgi:hypothetical protein
VSPEKGFRGAVLLAPGTFTCSGTITISANGVVLRGSGSKEGAGSTIKLAGRPHLEIAVRGPGGGRGSGAGGGDSTNQAFNAAETRISDAYVPSGAASFKVGDAAGFSIGDSIAIRRPVTTAWVKFMQMDNLVRDGRPQTWIRTGNTTTTERRIAGISGNIITLDVPLSDSFDARYLNPPGTTFQRFVHRGALRSLSGAGWGD